MPDSDPTDPATKDQPRASAPDGGLNDGFAAMAIVVLVVALIILVVNLV